MLLPARIVVSLEEIFAVLQFPPFLLELIIPELVRLFAYSYELVVTEDV